MKKVKIGDKLISVDYTGSGQYAAKKNARNPVLKRTGGRPDRTLYIVRQFNREPAYVKE